MSRKTTVAVALLCAGFLACSVASAQTDYTWAGADNASWFLGSSWTPSTAYPGLADTAIFSVNNTTELRVNLMTLTTGQVATIRFDSPANNYTIMNGTLELMSTTSAISHSSEGTNRISASLKSSSQVPIGVTNGVLTLSGTNTGLNAAFNVTGPGKLVMGTTASAGASSTFALNGGTLELADAFGSINSLAASKFNYGGTTQAPDAFISPTVAVSYVDPRNGRTFYNADNNASAGILSPTLTPTERSYATGAVNYNGNWTGLFPKTAGGDYFQVLITGQLDTTRYGAGVYKFSVPLSDDRAGVWLDSNRNGIFETTERVVWESGTLTSTPSLLANTTYNMMIGFIEGNGGDSLQVQFTAPTGITTATDLNPTAAAQTGMWTHQETVASQYGNAVSVAGNSTIKVANSNPTALGALTLADASTLNLDGGATFASTGLAAGAATINTMSTVWPSSPGVVTAGAGTTLTKTGPGLLDMTKATNVLGAGSIVAVSAGTLRVAGANDGTTSLAGATVTLSGGTLNVVGMDYTVANAEGLKVGGLAGAFDVTTANPGNLGLRAGIDASLKVWGAGARTPYNSANPWHYNGALADGLGDSDNKTLVYTGEIYLAAGSYSFIGCIDDSERLSIGPTPTTMTQVFSDGTWNTPDTGPLSVLNDGWYAFEYRAGNGTGGFGFSGQGGGNWGTSTFGFGMKSGAASTDPLAYTYPLEALDGTATLFRFNGTVVASLADMSSSAVDVTQSSAIAAAINTKFGAMTLADGVTLTTSASGAQEQYIRTASLTAAGSATLSVTNYLYPGVFTQGVAGSTITKKGTGYMLFDSLAAPAVDNNTTFDIQAGWVGVQGDGTGDARTLPAAAFQLNGGGLVVSASAAGTVNFDNAITLAGAGGSFEARAVGMNDTTAAVTVVRPNGITIPGASPLTMRANGLYQIQMDGDLSGAGNLIKTGDSTVTLNSVSYTGTTTVSAGTLIINEALTLTDTSLITVSAGMFKAGSTMDTAAVAVVAGAAMQSVGNARIGTFTTSGTSTFDGDLTVGVGGMTATGAGHSTTVAGNLDATGTTVTVTGGNLAVAGTTTADALRLTGGRLAATGTITVPKPGGQTDSSQFTLGSGGVLSLEGPDAAAALPDFSVGGGAGSTGWLNIAVAQNNLPIITVTSGSLVQGVTSGIEIRGVDNTTENTKLILGNGAVFGGDTEPDTDALGDNVRVLRAITSEAVGAVYVVGDDGSSETKNDIYNGVVYGPWSRSNWTNPATVYTFKGTIQEGMAGQGLMINMNGENVPLSGDPTFNTTNTDFGVKFYGGGKLTMSGAPLGTWTKLTREGTGWNNDSLQLGTTADNVVATGKTVVLVNGQGRLGRNAAIQAGGALNIGNGGMLLEDDTNATAQGMEISTGTFNVLPGGMVWVRNTDRFAKGATWNWTAGSWSGTDPTLGAGTFIQGAALGFRQENNNMWQQGAGNRNWPNDVDFIFDEEGACNLWTTGPTGNIGFLVAGGARVITRSGGNANFNDGGDTTGGGLKAAWVTGYLGANNHRAANGETVAIIALVDPANWATRRGFWFWDATDLRTRDAAGVITGAMNVVIGSDSLVTTTVGNSTAKGDAGLARLSVPAYGEVRVERTFLAGDLTIKSGFFNLNPTADDYNTVTGIGGVGLKRVFRVNNIYGQNGYHTDDLAGQGADFWFNSGGVTGATWFNRNDAQTANDVRSIAGSIYWRGEELWIEQNYTSFISAVPTATTGFANNIFVGPQSRLTFNPQRGVDVMPWTTNQAAQIRGRTINQPVTIEGSGGVWQPHVTAWNFKLRREDGAYGDTYNYFLPNMTLADGAVLSSLEDNATILTTSLTFLGTGITSQRGGSQWEIQDILSGGPGATWQIGEAGGAVTTHTMYGKMGDPSAKMGLKLVNGTLNFASNTLMDLTNLEFLGGTLNQFPGQGVRTARAAFGVAKNLELTDIQFASGVAITGGIVSSSRDTGTASWAVVDGGEVTLIGPGALANVSAMDLGGGKISIRQNGNSQVGLAVPTAVTVNAGSTLDIDRQTAAGGVGKTLSFGALTLNNGLATVRAGSGYNVAFGATTVATSGSSGVELFPAAGQPGPVNATFASVNFSGGWLDFAINGSGSDVRLGALSGLADATVSFAGGTLHLPASDAWAGRVTIRGPQDVLAVDQDLSGYYHNDNLRTVTVEQGTTDVLAYPAGGTLAGVATQNLKLSTSMANVVGPYGYGTSQGGLGGTLILNTPLVAGTFSQTDGSGGSRAFLMGDVTPFNPTSWPAIVSQYAGANFAAPLALNGQMVSLGEEGSTLGGADFAISGDIGGTGGWGFVNISEYVTNRAFTKVGSETVTLSGLNTFAGDVAVLNGTLVMGSASAFGQAGNTVMVDGPNAVMVIAALPPALNGTAGGYNLVLANGGTVDVRVNGMDLRGLPEIPADGALKLSNTMAGSTPPTLAVLGRTILNTDALDGGFALGLSGTIVADQDVTVPWAADMGQATTGFSVAAGKTLTIQSNLALAGARTWDKPVAGGTVAFTGDITGSDPLTFVDSLTTTGPGKLILGGAGNKIALLTIGSDTTAGGIVQIGADAAKPTSVVIKAGGLYTVDKANYGFGEVDAATSIGVVGLSKDSSEAISFADGEGPSLGAAQGDRQFTGVLTPGTAGYKFGGGEGTLILKAAIDGETILSAGNPAQFGWAGAANSPLPMGRTIVAAATNLNGAVDVYQQVQIQHAGAFAQVPATPGVTIHTDAAIDFGDMLNPTPDLDPLVDNHLPILGNIRLQPGASVSNNDRQQWLDSYGESLGGALTFSDLAMLFPSDATYVMGSDFAGKTTIQNGGLPGQVMTNESGLRKVGTSELEVPSGQLYRGTTFVEGGTFTAQAPSSFGLSTDIRVSQGARVNLTGRGDTGTMNAQVTLSGTLDIRPDDMRMEAPDESGATAALVLAGSEPSLIVSGSKLTITKLTDLVDGTRQPVTLIKSGPGELALVSTTSDLAKTAVIRVAEGKLTGVNTAGVGSLSGATIELANGTRLELAGTTTLAVAGLPASYFGFNNDAHHNLAGTYTVTANGLTSTGAAGLLTQTPVAGGRGIQTIAWNFQDTTVPTHKALFPGLTTMVDTPNNGTLRENYMILWTGQFNAPEAGRYTFYSYSDDMQSMWVDVNGDGVFQAGLAATGAGDQVGQTNWRIQGTDAAPYTVDSSVLLSAAGTYNVAFTFREGGGGDYSRMRVLTPSAAAAGTLLANAPYIMDAGQAGWWTHFETSGTRTYGNDVRVMGDSTIAEPNLGLLDLGALQMQAGSKLTLVGAANFTGTSFAGDGPRTVTIDTSTAVGLTSSGVTTLGAVNDGGVATRIIKTGPGILRLADLTSTLSSGTVVDIQAGKLVVAANTNSGSAGSATLRLTNTDLSVEASVTAGTMGNGLSGRYYLGDLNPDVDWSSLTAAVAKREGPIDSSGGFGPRGDNFSAWWSGYLYTPPSLLGSIYFEMMTDDEGGLWIDGVKKITTNNTTANSTVAITKMFTPITMKMHENAGGEQAHLRWNVGGGIVPIPLTNLWDAPLPAADMSASPLDLAGAVTLNAPMSVSFGAMTVADGSVINVLPGSTLNYLRLAGTTMAGNARFVIPGTMYAGAFTQAAGGSTITKADNGYLVFDNLLTAPTDDLTTVRVPTGYAVNMVNGSVSGLRQGTFLLDGGGLVLSSASIAGGTSSAPIQVTATGGTLEARAYGLDAMAGNRAAYGATVVTQGGPVSIDAGGTLTAFAQGNYDLKFTGTVSGAGNLNLTGGNVTTALVDVNNLAVSNAKLTLTAKLSVQGTATVTDSTVTAAAPDALSGVSSMLVSSVNSKSMLNLGVAQVGMGQVTIGPDSVVLGDNTGLLMSGSNNKAPETNLVFQDGAILGSTLATPIVPTTDQLGLNDLGQQLRIKAALFGGNTLEVVRIGDDLDPLTTDDVFSGVAFGTWTRSNVLDPASDRPFTGTLTDLDARGLLIDTNGETSLAINGTTQLNTANAVFGAKFFGAGNLAITGTPGGSWTRLTRVGTDRNLEALSVSGAGAIANGKTVSIGNGRVRVSPDNVIATGGTLEIAAGGVLAFDNPWADFPGMRITSGTVNVLAGGVVFVRNTDRFTRGATWEWTRGTLNATSYAPGSILIFRTENFNPADSTKNWPNNVQFIFDETGSCDTWATATAPAVTGFPVAGGAFLVGRSNGDSQFDGGTDALGGGLRAAGTATYGYKAVAGETIGIAASSYWTVAAGNNNRRSFLLYDATDLRVSGGGMLNVVIGNDGPMTTSVGNLNTALESRIMGGEVQVRRTFLAGDVTVKSGKLNFNMDSDEFNLVTGTSGGLKRYLRIGTLTGTGGYQTADGANGGSSVWFNQVANFNKNDAGTGIQRSITGGIVWRGEELWIGNAFTSFVAVAPAAPTNIFSEMITVGPSSRLTFNQQMGQTTGADGMPWDAATKGRINRQPITFEGSGGVWLPHNGGSIWNFKQQNENGAAVLAGAAYQYFPNITMQDGAVISVNESTGTSSTAPIVFLSLALEGNAVTTLRSSQFDLVNVTNARPGTAPTASVTLTVGELGQANVTSHDIRGQMGGGMGPVVLDLIRGTLNFWTGGSLAADATVRNVGAGWNANNYTPDGYITVYTGRNGTGCLTTGTIVLSGGQDMLVAVSPGNNTAANWPYVNKIDTKIQVTAEAAWANNQGYNGTIQGDAYEIDGTPTGTKNRRGIVHLTNVEVGDGAVVRLNDADTTDLVANVSVPAGNGSLLVAGQNDTIHIGNVTGAGTLTITGTTAAVRAFGVVSGTLIWGNPGTMTPTTEALAPLELNGATLGYEPGGFRLDGGTLGASQGTVAIGQPIGVGVLRPAGGVLDVTGAVNIAGITQFEMAGGTLQIREDAPADFTWPPVVANVSAVTNLSLMPVTAVTDQTVSFPSLSFGSAANQAVNIRGTSGYKASFGSTTVADGGYGRVISNTDAAIGPVFIGAGATFVGGSSGTGNVTTPTVTGGPSATFKVGVAGPGSVTVTDTLAGFLGATVIDGGTLKTAGANLIFGGPVTNDGTLRVIAGLTDLSDRVLTSTPAGTGTVTAGALQGMFYNTGTVGATNTSLDNGPHYLDQFAPTATDMQTFPSTNGIWWATAARGAAINPVFTQYLGVGQDNGTALLRGFLTVPTDGTYYFNSYSDDGSAIWIGSTRVTYSPNGHGLQDAGVGGNGYINPIQLTAGVPYEYNQVVWDSGGDGGLITYWGTSPSPASMTLIPMSAFSYARTYSGGNITVDGGASLKVQGFTEHQTVNVAGTMELMGAGPSVARSGIVSGSLIGHDSIVRFTDNLIIEGSAPSIDLGTSGSLHAGTATIRGPMTFNAGNRSRFGTLAVVPGGSATIGSGSAIDANAVVVRTSGKLAINGGTANLKQVQVKLNGVLELNGPSTLGGMTGVDNGGTVAAKTGLTDLGDVVITSPKRNLLAVVGADIGGPGVAGSSSYDLASDTYTVTGGGGDIWGAGDQFYYLYAPLPAGKATTMVARVLSIHDVAGDDTAMNEWTKAGIMIRNSAAGDSTNSFVAESKLHNVTQQRRPATAWDSGVVWTGDGRANSIQAGAPAPYWIKMVYDGTDQFTGYFAPDTGLTPSDSAWTAMASWTVNMTGDMLVGLAVTSHDNARATTAVFDNFSGFGYEEGGKITVDSEAILKAAGFTDAASVSLTGTGRFELTGKALSDTFALSLEEGSQLKIGEGGVLVREGDLATIMAEVTAGQITTDLLAQNAEWRLGVAQTPDGVKVKVTILGDLDLNGVVGSGDLAVISGNYGLIGPGAGWGTGDITGSDGSGSPDGRVDWLDYLMLKQYFGRTFDGTGSVPEPATLGLLALGLGGLLLKRRSRK